MKKFILLSLMICIFNICWAQSLIQKTKNEVIKEDFRKRILINPDSLSLHENFINSYENIENVISQYDLWILKYKKSHIIPFAIGKALFNKENINASKYLIIATKANSNLAEAWYYLAIDAQRKGNSEDEINFSNKAAISESSSGLYLFQKAYSYYKKNKYTADSLMIEVARKFNLKNFGAKALLTLSLKEENITIKIIRICLFIF